jgi:hypothetical protein
MLSRAQGSRKASYHVVILSDTEVIILLLLLLLLLLLIIIILLLQAHYLISYRLKLSVANNLT